MADRETKKPPLAGEEFGDAAKGNGDGEGVSAETAEKERRGRLLREGHAVGGAAGVDGDGGWRVTARGWD